MRQIITGIIISYFLGSIPTAYIFGRLLKGIDIRKFGSGNVGATNALRVLGKGPGILVLLLDIAKGFAAVVFLGSILIARQGVIPGEILRIVLGVSCICGHNWTVFLNFKGGKGVATTLGVFIGLSLSIPGLRIIVPLLVLTWLIAFLIARIVSVASVIVALALPVYMAVFKQSRALVITSIVLSLFSLFRHRSNLLRVIQGKESRLSFRKKSS